MKTIKLKKDVLTIKLEYNEGEPEIYELEFNKLTPQVIKRAMELAKRSKDYSEEITAENFDEFIEALEEFLRVVIKNSEDALELINKFDINDPNLTEILNTISKKFEEKVNAMQKDQIKVRRK